MSNAPTPITVAYGDGIGPEIMTATLEILTAAGARLDPQVIEIGKAVYERGSKNGIEESSWESLKRTKVFLKSPITTPQGGGFKSLNVTVRKTLSLYANVRPCVSYHPFVETKQPGMDLVIIRENEEDLYAGVEYRPSNDVFHCLKVITREGCERIIRYAFEYARANNRKKVTSMAKDNIMKMCDGLFQDVFREIGAEYPDIQQETYIIDIGAARIASRPQDFDVIVTENLYGDIISDIAAEVTGSVGLGGSSNIGAECAMFEAIHGSAPDIAGKGIANPSGLLLGAIMMLVHIGQNDVAESIHNAWLKTLEDGVHTGDIYKEGNGISKEKVGTEGFTKAVIARLGQKPTTMPAIDYGAPKPGGLVLPPLKPLKKVEKTVIGFDVHIDAYGAKADDIAAKIKGVCAKAPLSMISNRGVKVYPDGDSLTNVSGVWRCRFITADKSALPMADVMAAATAISHSYDVTSVEVLAKFGDSLGFTVSQGE